MEDDPPVRVLVGRNGFARVKREADRHRLLVEAVGVRVAVELVEGDVFRRRDYPRRDL